MKKINEISNKLGDKYSITGRISKIRTHGKLTFVDCYDNSGEIQLMLDNKDLLNYKSILKNLKQYNLVSCEGCVFYTRTGQKSLKLTMFDNVATNELDNIDKYHGINNPRHRGRSYELMQNPNLLNNIMMRSNIISDVRNYFQTKGFYDVETPILHEEETLSKAKSFKTFSNQINKDVFLRKTPELYLKQLIFSGIQNVFEIGKNFRNEIVTKRSQPEFSVIEAYSAFRNYMDMEEIMTKLLLSLEKHNINESLNKIEVYEFKELVPDKSNKTNELSKKINAQIEKIGNKPIIVRNYPRSMSPLSEQFDDFYAKETKLFLDKILLSHWCSEETDYDIQRNNFIRQAKENKVSDYNPDNDAFLNSIKIGVPPLAGIGIGLDRLIMYLLNEKDLNKCIPFPK